MTIQEQQNRAHREEWVTVIQFALLVQYHPHSIYRMVEEGRLPGAVRVGSRSIRINKAQALRSLQGLPSSTPSG